MIKTTHIVTERVPIFLSEHKFRSKPDFRIPLPVKTVIIVSLVSTAYRWLFPPDALTNPAVVFRNTVLAALIVLAIAWAMSRSRIWLIDHWQASLSKFKKRKGLITATLESYNLKVTNNSKEFRWIEDIRFFDDLGEECHSHVGVRAAREIHFPLKPDGGTHWEHHFIEIAWNPRPAKDFIAYVTLDNGERIESNWMLKTSGGIFKEGD